LPQRDAYHGAVRAALIKDGWKITHDPLVLSFGERSLRVDLGAEAPLAAERDGRKIAVEVKSFVGRSEITDLERALGQYSLYSFLLARQEPDRALYLAIPEDTYLSLFDTAEGRDLIAAQELCLLVFHPKEEEIVRWIEPNPTRRL
jgi:XisH protein